MFAVQMLFLQYKCYFCSTNAIFAVQMLFFWCAEQKNFELTVQTFAALWLKFCHLVTQVLPPYDSSFAALWPSTKKLRKCEKV